MNVKKQLLIILLICVAIISAYSEDKSFITDDWKEELNELEEKDMFYGNIGPVIRYDNQLLVQYESYYYQERRYKTYYLSVEYGIFWDIFVIDPKYEIKSIKKDNDKYYAVLWNDIDSYLAEKSIGQDKWERILTFANDNSKGFTLYAEKGKVCVVSESKIYLNLDNTEFKAFDIPTFSGSDRIQEPSIGISKNNTIYFGNNFGEWGGNLYKVVYDSEKEILEYTKLMDQNIDKVVITRADDIYCLLSSAHGLSATTALYKIDGKEVNTLFYKTTYAPIRPNMTFPDDSVDVYGWKDIIGSNMIRDVVTFEDKLLFLISNIGVYYIDSDNKLEKIKDLPFFEEKYTINNGDSPYNTMNSVKQLSIEDNTISVIYRLPLIFSTEVSFE